MIKEAIKSRLWKLKLRLVDLKLKTKAAIPRFAAWIKTIDSAKIKNAATDFILGIKPFFKDTSADLSEWTMKGPQGKIRAVLLALFLCIIFAVISSSYTFLANDAFISFRYVSNVIRGWGYTWNPPPFEVVNGYTSFLWLALLRYMWAIGIQPPYAAHILTFLFSMGTVWMGFLFIRRMPLPTDLQRKGLFVFFIYCIVLLTNRTFLAFMSSGTEAALFNFLAIWWTYEATSKTRNPIWLSTAAILLTLCRLEGAIFLPFTVFLLIVFMFKRPIGLCLLGLLVLPIVWFYYNWHIRIYGSYKPNWFLALHHEDFPNYGKDYLFSFIVEYALYFWSIFFIAWAGFKCLRRRKKDLFIPFCVIAAFCTYASFYVFIIGGDILEYRPFGMLIPLCTLGAIYMIMNNINKTFKFMAIVFALYLLFSTPIPWTHRSLTKDLSTRKETAFLYKPIAQKAGMFVMFPEYWDKAQKTLIYQGIGLRHQEHKVLTEELLKSMPSRDIGRAINLSQKRLFSWDFVGVAGWVFPDVIIIDTSGQNDLIVARSDLKFENSRRLFYHDRVVPHGYLNCFKGGPNLRITPFDGTPDFELLRSSPLTDGDIKGCEGFWKAQANKSKRGNIRLRAK